MSLFCPCLSLFISYNGYEISFCLSRMYKSAVRLQEFLLGRTRRSLPTRQHRNAEFHIPFRILISHHFQMTPSFRWVFLLALVGRAASVPDPVVVDACALLCNPGAETESERARDPKLYPRYPKVNCHPQSVSDDDQAWRIASHCLKLCNEELSVEMEVNCFALRSSLGSNLGCYCEALTPLSPNTMRLHESWRLNFLVKELAKDIMEVILDSPLDVMILCEIHSEIYKDYTLKLPAEGKIIDLCKNDSYRIRQSRSVENVLMDDINLTAEEELTAEEDEGHRVARDVNDSERQMEDDLEKLPTPLSLQNEVENKIDDRQTEKKITARQVKMDVAADSKKDNVKDNAKNDAEQSRNDQKDSKNDIYNDNAKDDMKNMKNKLDEHKMNSKRNEENNKQDNANDPAINRMKEYERSAKIEPRIVAQDDPNAIIKPVMQATTDSKQDEPKGREELEENKAKRQVKRNLEEQWEQRNDEMKSYRDTDDDPKVNDDNMTYEEIEMMNDEMYASRLSAMEQAINDISELMNNFLNQVGDLVHSTYSLSQETREKLSFLRMMIEQTVESKKTDPINQRDGKNKLYNANKLV